nr:condensation domain-containing protein [Rhizobium leguminosarum]
MERPVTKSNYDANRRKDKSSRQLSTHERLLYLYSKRHHRHFCLVGELEGHIDETDFQKALEQVRRRHANLRFAIEDGEDGPGFVNHNKPLTIEVTTCDGSTDWKPVVEAELAKPFFPWMGPLIRTSVLKGSADPQQAVVVLTFHHSIADGLSAVALLQDLVHALNGAELKLSPERDSVEDLVRRIRGTEARAAGERTSPGLPDLETISAIAGRPLWRPFEADRPKVNAIALPVDLTSALIKRSRQEGTTVHGAICAAVAVANGSQHPAENYAIMSPISIRHALNIGPDEMGLFITAATLRVPIAKRAPLWDLARRFTDELNPLRSAQHLIESVAMVDGVFPRNATVDVACGLVGSLAYDAVVSNLGSVHTDLPEGVTRLRAVWGPMVLGRIRNERMIGVATTGGHLCLTEARPNHMPESLQQVAVALADAFFG